MAAPEQEKLLWDSAKLAVVMKSADRFMGVYAQSLVEQSDLAMKADGYDKLDIVDMGCGTGLISSKIMETLNDKAKGQLELTCADFADAMVEATAERIKLDGWKNATAIKADAQDTKLPSNKNTHILFNFGPFLLPKPMAGLSEAYRMLQPGGIFGCSTWQKVGWIDDLRAAFETSSELPQLASDQAIIQSFSEQPERWDSVDEVTNRMQDAGFEDVKVQAIPQTTRISGPEEYRAMFPGTLALLQKKWWTEEQRGKYSELAEETVVEYVKQRYNNGGFDWKWIGIVATGRKPL